MTTQSLEQYILSKLSNKESQDQINKVKKAAQDINEYVYFGNKYLNSKPNGQNYYGATQKLKWKKLYSLGHRTKYYSNNVVFTKDSLSQRVSLDNEAQEIINEINNYYKTPSFCSDTQKN